MFARLVSLGDHPDITIVDVLTVIGRNRLCNVRVESARVSRRHCCLAVGDDQIIVRDLSSTNGTFINGARINAGHLRSNEELSIANLRYRLEIESDDRDAIGRAATSITRRDAVARGAGPGSVETVLDASVVEASNG